jgi:hypothetical protein
MYEAWIKYVLMRAGILKVVQERIHIDYPGLLSVHGKQDFLGGGIVDPDRFKDQFDSEWIPDELRTISSIFVDKYAGKDLKDKVIEVKSISAFAGNSMEKWDKPIKNHEMQAFHYAKGQDKEDATLLYVVRDDARAFEYSVPNNSYVESKYVSDVKNMTKYINDNIRPPIEPLHYFDYGVGKFTKNLGVEYSSYLSMLYKFKSPREYSDSVKPSVERWNRVLNRYAKGDKITPKNIEVRDEILRMGYDFESLIFTVQELNISEDEQQEEV